MDVNISGTTLVRLAVWLAVTAIVVGIMIGQAVSADPAPATTVHPAGPQAAGR